MDSIAMQPMMPNMAASVSNATLSPPLSDANSRNTQTDNIADSAIANVPRAPVMDPPSASIDDFNSVDVSARFNFSELLSQLNQQLSASNMSVRFAQDELANRSVFTLQDSTSGELVRQVPAEEVLAISRNIQQFLETNIYARMGQTESSFAPGLLTDQQA